MGVEDEVVALCRSGWEKGVGFGGCGWSFGAGGGCTEEFGVDPSMIGLRFGGGGGGVENLGCCGSMGVEVGGEG
jgi:hypothetical protein